MIYYTADRPTWTPKTVLPGPYGILYSDGVNSNLYIGNFQINGSTINGSVNSLESYIGNTLISKISDFNVNANIVGTGAVNFYKTVLSGNDTIIGSNGNDTLYGYGPNSNFTGGAGDDIIWGAGNNNKSIYMTYPNFTILH